MMCTQRALTSSPSSSSSEIAAHTPPGAVAQCGSARTRPSIADGSHRRYQRHAPARRRTTSRRNHRCPTTSAATCAIARGAVCAAIEESESTGSVSARDAAGVMVEESESAGSASARNAAAATVEESESAGSFSARDATVVTVEESESAGLFSVRDATGAAIEESDNAASVSARVAVATATALADGPTASPSRGALWTWNMAAVPVCRFNNGGHTAPPLTCRPPEGPCCRPGRPRESTCVSPSVSPGVTPRTPADPDGLEWCLPRSGARKPCCVIATWPWCCSRATCATERRPAGAWEEKRCRAGVRHDSPSSPLRSALSALTPPVVSRLASSGATGLWSMLSIPRSPRTALR
jgi:hypothetical protein